MQERNCRQRERDCALSSLSLSPGGGRRKHVECSMRRKKESFFFFFFFSPLYFWFVKKSSRVRSSSSSLRRYRTCSFLVRVPSLRCGVVSETDMIHFIKSILSLGRFSSLSLPSFLQSVSVRSPLTVSAKGQRMKEGKKMGRRRIEGGREGGKEAMDCFAGSRTERTDGRLQRKSNQPSRLSFLPSLSSLASFRNLSDRPTIRSL